MLPVSGFSLVGKCIFLWVIWERGSLWNPRGPGIPPQSKLALSIRSSASASQPEVPCPDVNMRRCFINVKSLTFLSLKSLKLLSAQGKKHIKKEWRSGETKLNNKYQNAIWQLHWDLILHQPEWPRLIKQMTGHAGKDIESKGTAHPLLVELHTWRAARESSVALPQEDGNWSISRTN